MEKLLVEYIRRFPGSAMVIWPRVSNLPQVKKMILEDEEFVVNTLCKEPEFFEYLPKDYAHFICFYKAKNLKIDIKYMQFLYKKYYGDVLSDLDQLFLINWQIKLEENNDMNINPIIIRQPLEFGLKKIREDESFLGLKDKLQLEVHELMQFAFSYQNSDLYNELTVINGIDEELAKKIKILSQGRKIAGIDTLEDLKNTTLEELRSMDRKTIQVEEVSNTVIPNTGGPNSRTFKQIFQDSTAREIRRINQDGTVKIETVDRLVERHEDAVKRLYEGEVNYPDNCNSVFQRSIEAVKQLSTVTLVIEMEQCHIYLPYNISAEQKRIILQLIDSANKEGRFGIVSYNPETGKVSFHFEGRAVKKSMAIDAISGMGRDSIQSISNSEQKQHIDEDYER